MNTTRPKYGRILKNGIELNIVNNSKFGFAVNYPEEYKSKFTNLKTFDLEALGIKVMENLFVYTNYSYTCGLKDLLISTSLVLMNKNKIPEFEYIMNSLLEFISNKYSCMPRCDLNDFFVGIEETITPEIYGCVRYFVDMTTPLFAEFYDEANQCPKSIKIVDAIRLMKEIREIVGTSQTYKDFDQFIERMETFKEFEEIKKDEFYLLCHKRVDVTRIEDYEIEMKNIFSRGFLGSVHNAEYKGMDVVCKQMEKRNNDYLRVLQLREINILQMFYDNPFFVRMLGILEKENVEPIIVEEKLIEDVNHYLEKEIEVLKRTFSAFEIHQMDSLIMMTDILTTALILRQYGLIHRDYKPLNFLLTANNRCRLCDFGTILSDECEMTTIVGSRIFMSPDFSSTLDNVSGDVYALGMTLLQFFTPVLLHQMEFGGFHNLNKIPELLLAQINETKKRVGEKEKQFMEQILPILEASISERSTTRASYVDLYNLRLLLISYLEKEHNYHYDSIDQVADYLPFYKQVAAQEESLQAHINAIIENPSVLREETVKIVKHLLEIAATNEEKKKNILYQIRGILSFGFLSKCEFTDLLSSHEGYENMFYSN